MAKQPAAAKLPQRDARQWMEMARGICDLRIRSRVNSLGGYGPGGEVIYEGHPEGCPSALMDSRGDGTATFLSNGSVEFLVKTPRGDLTVLPKSFDTVEKRQTGPFSSNLWIEVTEGKERRIASLVNPRVNQNLTPIATRVVKLGDPNRSLWLIAEYKVGRIAHFRTAVCMAMVLDKSGPAILRRTYIENLGKKPLKAKLWSYWNLRGQQYFAYNKSVWYDAGIPAAPGEMIQTSTVPYSDYIQIKRASSRVAPGLASIGMTCDYLNFVGDTAALCELPEAVKAGKLLPGGAGATFNRFTTPSIAADGYCVSLAGGKATCLTQSLQFLTDAKLIEAFRINSQADAPLYPAMEKAYKAGCKKLIKATPDAGKLAALRVAGAGGVSHPDFRVEIPRETAVAHYANSVWTGVEELYENCRAHGAQLAEGIELGTRDRGQDMWPKIKQDPGRVRKDLVHALSFLYRTVPTAPRVGKKPLTLKQKLHGMFPRQYPSRWDDRSQVVMNDNRPYTDSPVWLLNSLVRYIRETGDLSILLETVGTIELTDPDRPEQSGIRGGKEKLRVVEVALEILACFERHVDDSPYGMVQILYGDWCDPVDMFGTGRIGDTTTRGAGRGTNTRLSCHVCVTTCELIDVLASEASAALLKRHVPLAKSIEKLQRFADRLRQAIVKVAWEPTKQAPGFIDSIHELNKDGKKPNYRKGETGYCLGSMNPKREFDGRQRRVLTTTAWGVRLLQLDRPYLKAVPGRDAKLAALLKTNDQMFFDKQLGLKLYSVPLANCQQTLDLVGRMGVVPSGCAENGEYHHAQTMMHLFRLDIDGEADTVWRQFRPMLSAFRDESLLGPFEMPSTSYASDARDPHFGGGMYFGLSGSTDWIVEIFERIAGVELNLHDPELSDISIVPALPSSAKKHWHYERILHVALAKGGYRDVPFSLTLRPGIKRQSGAVVRINGKAAAAAVIESLAEMDHVKIEIKLP